MKNLYLLILSNSVTKFGSSLTRIAIVLYLFEKTNSVFNLSLFYMLISIISLLFGPLIGMIVDYFNRKSVIIFAEVANSVIIIILLLKLNIIQFLYLAIVLNHLFFMTSSTGRNSILKDLFNDQELVEANHLLVMSDSLIRIIGPVIGTVIYYLLNPHFIFLIVSSSFMLSALIISLVNYNQGNKEEVYVGQNTSTTNLKRLFSELSELRYIFSIYFISMFIITVINIMAPFYVTEVLHASKAYIGILDSALGLGMFIVFILYKLLKEKFNSKSDLLNFILGKAFIAIALILCGISFSKMIVIFSFFLIGIGVFLSTSYSNIIIQKETSRGNLAKVISINSSLIQLSVIMSTILCTYISSIVSIQHFFIIGGILIIIVISILGVKKHKIIR